MQSSTTRAVEEFTLTVASWAFLHAYMNPPSFQCEAVVSTLVFRGVKRRFLSNLWGQLLRFSHLFVKDLNDLHWVLGITSTPLFKTKYFIRHGAQIWEGRSVLRVPCLQLASAGFNVMFPRLHVSIVISRSHVWVLCICYDVHLILCFKSLHCCFRAPPSLLAQSHLDFCCKQALNNGSIYIYIIRHNQREYFCYFPFCHIV